MLVHSNPFVRIFDDEVEFADGSDGHYLRIESGGEGLGAVILPVCRGAIGLVKTFRYPLDEWEWALPRGFAEDPDPLVTAREELREELGISARSLELIGTFSPDSGMFSQKVAVVLATVDDPAGDIEDLAEVGDTRWVELPALWDEISDGRLTDGMTLAALALATVRGFVPSSSACD